MQSRSQSQEPSPRTSCSDGGPYVGISGHVSTPVAPIAGRFSDPRRIPFGPIPESWGRWDGLYVAGNDVVLSYTVQGTKIHEQRERGEHPDASDLHHAEHSKQGEIWRPWQGEKPQTRQPNAPQQNQGDSRYSQS